MEKMQTGRRIITTLPVHGHQNRLIYALTMLLIAKIIIFRLLGIRQGIFSSGNGDKYFPIALPNAVLGIALSIGHGASDPAFYSALTTRYVTITDAKGAVSIIVVGW